MGKLDSSVYNQAEFKKADMAERIRMYLVGGGYKSHFQLRDNEIEYLGYMEIAYTLSQENRSQREAVRLLRTQLKTDRFRATQVMRDACNLFGSFEDVHRPTQRAMIREGLLQDIAQIEKELDDAETSTERMAWMKVKQGHWKNLMELDQVSKLEDAIARDTKLPEISFTTDPSALMSAEAEDIDHEVI
jgi:hypothetical protein